MKAILLAAGFGTRLRPLTNTIPKCLVPMNGKPLLQIWLERLTKAGLNNFLINTHYLANRVEDFIGNSSFQNFCTIKHETELLGTAGTLIANLDYIVDEDVMLIHADNFCLANFSEFIEAHLNRPSGCLLTMMIFKTSTPESCGIVKLDEAKRVVEFHEKVKNPPSDLANGAIYILSSELIQLFKSEYKDTTDFSTEVIPQLMGKIYTYKTDNVFVDIGTPEAYAEANKISQQV